MACLVALIVTGVLPIISWFATYRFSISSAICVGIFTGSYILCFLASNYILQKFIDILNHSLLFTNLFFFCALLEVFNHLLCCLLCSVVLVAFCGASYLEVVNNRDDQVPRKDDFLAALLPLMCIPALLSLCSGLVKWLVIFSLVQRTAVTVLEYMEKGSLLIVCN